MPRHFLDDPIVADVVQGLVKLVREEGSVNAAQRRLVATLSSDKSEGWIHPNRLHSILSADRSRAVNSDTLETFRVALSRLPPDRDHASDRDATLRDAALRAWEAAADSSGNGDAARIGTVASRLNLPLAVVSSLLDDAGVRVNGVIDAPSHAARRSPREPDWSFQNTAHERCLAALARDANRKVGLVLPTGGGKTRAAMRIALSTLDAADRDDSVVLWVTHRTRLKTQAHRELQRAITEGTPDLPENAVELLGSRVEFCMLSDLQSRLDELRDRIQLVVVDEAHHAAANSYQPIFDHRPLRGLFLTATPNRTDLLPIGIDEIAYTITSRELFERGVIIEPRLEALTLVDFDWDTPDELRNLADTILDRAQADFVKTLVVVSRVDQAIGLHAALVSVLEEDYDHHVLSADDLSYVHGSGASTGESSETFLDEFAARPRGLLVATTQLLGEGFDDPAINAVVVTYPTTSMLQLMQAAGRCLRWTPDKRAAYVVQVKDSPLAYHWEQRWLYQDISDVLRPQLVDAEYSSIDDLRGQVSNVLVSANVPPAAAASVQAALDDVEAGENMALLLTGLPFGEEPEEFGVAARWNAVPVTRAERDLFLRLFNDFSARGANVNDFSDFLRNYLPPDPAPASMWKRYIDMLHSMSYAHREITGEPYDAARSRAYTPAVGTTWLQYVTFHYAPALPQELETFLADAVNRDDVASQYLDLREKVAAAIKVPLPLAGAIAFLLDAEQAQWVQVQRDELRSRLENSPPYESFGVIEEWRHALAPAPVPQLVIERFDRYLRTDDFNAYTLSLPAQSGA